MTVATASRPRTAAKLCPRPRGKPIRPQSRQAGEERAFAPGVKTPRIPVVVFLATFWVRVRRRHDSGEIVHAARNRLLETRTADGLKAAEMLAKMCGCNEPELGQMQSVEVKARVGR
jgi:hypothetical protein